MNTSRLLPLLGLATLSVAASAQLSPPLFNPPVHFTEFNAITNPSFEPALGGWDRSGSYYFDSFDNYHPDADLVLSSTINHSGGHGAIFELSGTSLFGNTVVASISQVLSTPLAGSSVWQANFWAYSDYSNIYVSIGYTDGTYTRKTFSIDSEKPAWVNFDMRSMVNESKTIKSIYFSSSNGFDNLVIDDVSLDYLAID